MEASALHAEPAGEGHIGGEERASRGIEAEQNRAGASTWPKSAWTVAGGVAGKVTWCQGTKGLACPSEELGISLILQELP